VEDERKELGKKHSGGEQGGEKAPQKKWEFPSLNKKGEKSHTRKKTVRKGGFKEIKTYPPQSNKEMNEREANHLLPKEGTRNGIPRLKAGSEREQTRRGK